MLSEISPQEIIAKLRTANRWWRAELGEAALPFVHLRERAYFELFHRVATTAGPSRAVVLMGPRRVGKTVLAFHLFRRLLQDGEKKPGDLVYIDLQQPVYSGIRLEEMFNYALQATGATDPRGMVVCYDEIQYLRNWDVQLKTLVDDYPETRFLATGSAAAALRLKSIESGAGRFTDFLLPPLTFFEFLQLKNKEGMVGDRGRRGSYPVDDIESLNDQFVDYLNYGGYPESALSEAVQSDLERYIRSDIIDKVLLKDLPALYGIQDIQELNRLFTTLAYNTSHIVSLDSLEPVSELRFAS